MKTLQKFNRKRNKSCSNKKQSQTTWTGKTKKKGSTNHLYQGAMVWTLNQSWDSPKSGGETVNIYDGWREGRLKFVKREHNQQTASKLITQKRFIEGMGIKLEAHECEQRITKNMIIRLKIGKTFESSFLESEQTQLDTGKTGELAIIYCKYYVYWGFSWTDVLWV